MQVQVPNNRAEAREAILRVAWDVPKAPQGLIYR